VENSAAGATSAVRAGCPTVGNLLFVPAGARPQRRAQLVDAGVLTVVTSWPELAEVLLPVGPATVPSE